MKVIKWNIYTLGQVARILLPLLFLTICITAPLSTEIVFAEVMFDLKNEISGELPEHIDFVNNIAIPKFESWGYKVTKVRSDKDYLDCFYHVVTRSVKHPERNGRYSGFPISGLCMVNRDVKIKAIKKAKSLTSGKTQIIGIAIDEPKRLEKVHKDGNISLLEQYGLTEQDAYNLCKEYGLLSPIYEHSSRGGCWFCPNLRPAEAYNLYCNNQDLWNLLENLSHEDNTVSDKFYRGGTFENFSNKMFEWVKKNPEEAERIRNLKR